MTHRRLSQMVGVGVRVLCSRCGRAGADWRGAWIDPRLPADYGPCHSAVCLRCWRVVAKPPVGSEGGV